MGQILLIVHIAIGGRMQRMSAVTGHGSRLLFPASTWSRWATLSTPPV